MGNSLGCSASGERLVSAARDGDLLEAKMLLEFNPCLAKYSTFGGLNTPLHFAASKGHNDIAALLLENGADVNSRNYCGQTAIMQACRYGYWEVVQTLLVHKSNVTKADYLNGRTALHFAAVGGHVRCVRLVVADYVHSGFFQSGDRQPGNHNTGSRTSSSPGLKYDHHALKKFVSKPADGGITALHMAALNGHYDCVQLLLDLNASVSTVTLHYGSSANLIGAGSTPLHYAACGGNLKCCQVLLAKGGCRLTLNCNGWLPSDIARIWGRHWLETLLSPSSSLDLPVFHISNYLSLPLMSILNIAREYGMQSSDDNDDCVVCLERTCTVAAEGCGHELCTKCALCLCSSSTSILASDTVGIPGSIPCPLCRQGIVSFLKLPSIPVKGLKLKLGLSLCNPCVLHSHGSSPPSASCDSCLPHHNPMNPDDDSVSPSLTCPVSCSPFPSCTCDCDPCPTLEAEGEAHAATQSPGSSRLESNTNDESEVHGFEKTNCSKMFWNRRSGHREQQCNSEINV
ncbi:E3 ubiquitin-protein ligase XBAT33 [Zostera marina]|uniref:RING-type E3 ubiquitin transferase n=1 Tax=Zostera marina TaxID=29655 RepID=A0A0K9P3M9_ZOSMR|nr:E3 ubiquitin-protein ligase XBAT33 [Zostera marina]